MFGDDFHHLEVLNGHTFVTGLAGHAHALEHLCGIRAGTDRTGCAKTVVLAVGRLPYATETMALDNTLETFTFGGTHDVNEIVLVEEVDADNVTELVLAFESFELGQVTLGVDTGFLEVTELGLGAMLLFLVFKTELEGTVAVGLNSLDLGNHTRAYFDNSARHVLAVGTENGCHSDFLS